MVVDGRRSWGTATIPGGRQADPYRRRPLPMAQKFRITYATLSADNEDLQRSYDEAAERVKAELGKEYPVIVNGEERWRDDRYVEPSPIDETLVKIGRASCRERVEIAVGAGRIR